MKPSYDDLRAERNEALALLAESNALNARLAKEHQHAFDALDELSEGFWEAEEDREAWQQRGAEALQRAFPTLFDDFTEAWFIQAAGIVINAS